MKLSDKLYEAVEDIWNGYYEHPFVKGIGTGSLEKEKFQFYMIQDYLYLLDYAKVFALGVVKAKEESVMRSFANLVHGTLNGEMAIHKTYMERLHITPEEIKQAKPSLVTTSYTNYMLWVGENEGLLPLAVSILACSWSYQKIGCKLAEIPGAIDHPFYGEWIKGYSTQDYKLSNDNVLDLVNYLGKNASDGELENLKTIFINCSRYEGQFWDMAYTMSL